MKFVKMLGLAAVAAAVLMPFVGSSAASATVLCKTVPTGTPTGTTCPMGWAMGAGDKIHAMLAVGGDGTLTSNEAFKPNITCKKTTIELEVSAEGSATETAKGKVTALTIEECGENVVTVLNKGVAEIHWIDETHNGTLTGSGQEITVTVPSIFGNIHCIYKTNATDLGTLVGSKNGNETAVMYAESVPIPYLVTSSLCPSKPTWDASYTVTTPDTLTIAGHT